MRIAAIVAVLIAAIATSGYAVWREANTSPYDRWAVLVASGDFHAHDGGPSRAFDNARRDVVTELEHVGFRPQNIRQYSAWARYFARDAVEQNNAQTAAALLANATKTAKDGCLVYFSTHGVPEGIVLGNEILSPNTLAKMLNQSCGARPTVVVISACFSGVFVPKLKGPNRLIVTAARRDRTSFGCGTTDTYPYFDTCFLHTLAQTHDFKSLALKTRECVAQMEFDTGMEPPSEPQISIGKTVLANLKSW